MLLRPRDDGTFQVIGECFIYGLHDASSLLGSVPAPWIAQNHQDSTGLFSRLRFFNTDLNVLADDDPRLGPLPEEWKPHDHHRSADDPRIFSCFQNKLTDEITNSDPRMAPEALEERGVKLRPFSLV